MTLRPDTATPPVVTPASETRPHTMSPSGEALRMFMRNPSAVVGLIVLTLVSLATLFGPYLYTTDPFDMFLIPFTEPFSDSEAPLGSDHMGRDILAQILVGGSATLSVGLLAALITVVIGVLVGALSGYFGGYVDELLMRVTEFFQVLPQLVFAMVLVSLFSPSLLTITLAIGIVSWPTTARLARAEFLRIRQLDYIKASRSLGAGNAYLIFRVILPNATPPLVVSATMAIGTAILFEAGLSFLGLGDPNVVSWGMMIGQGRTFLHDVWWTVTIPGLMIFLTVLAVSMIGDGLNDAFNPRLRER